MAATGRLLAPAMIQRYVEGGGTRCPYCESDDIEAGPLEVEGESASGLVECNACGEQWREFFTLRTVDAVDPNERHLETRDPRE